MARFWATLMVVVVSSLGSCRLFAQDTLVVDLATTNNDTVAIRPGRYRILIRARLPKSRYSVSVAMRDVPISPLPPPIAPEMVGCGQLSKRLEAALQLAREEDVPQFVHDLQAAISQAAPDAGCRDIVQRARRLIDSTSSLYPDMYKIQQGQYLAVTVSRIGDGANSSRRWEKTFTTGPTGEWKLSYGFIFPIESGIARHGVFADQVEYFSRQVSDSHFVVTQQRSTKAFDAIPAIVFSFAPASEYRVRWNALVGGLGADITNPTAFLGTGLTYRSNLIVSAGLVVRKEATLSGRYGVGDTITTDLESDQLQTQVFKLRPFFALTFRFSTSPFKPSGSTGAPGTQAKPEPSKAPSDSTSKPPAKPS